MQHSKAFKSKHVTIGVEVQVFEGAHHDVILPGFLAPKVGGATAGGDNEVAEYAFKDQIEMLVKRGIVEQCCHNRCSVPDLQNYCN